MNERNLLFAIGEIDERFLDALPPIRPSAVVRRPRIGRLLPAAMLALLIAAAAVLLPLNRTPDTPQPALTHAADSTAIEHSPVTLPPTDTTTAPPETTTAASPPESASQTIDMSSVFVNEISFVPAAALRYYSPDLYDKATMTAHEISAYFGHSLSPAWLPDYLSQAPQNDARQTFTFIIERDSGTVCMDRVTYGYYHAYENGLPANTASIPARCGYDISFSRLGLIGDCIYLLPENEVKPSIIADTTVTIGVRAMPYGPYDALTHEPAGSYLCYVADFTVDDIRCQLVAEQMPLEDVVRVIRGYLEAFSKENK